MQPGRLANIISPWTVRQHERQTCLCSRFRQPTMESPQDQGQIVILVANSFKWRHIRATKPKLGARWLVGLMNWQQLAYLVEREQEPNGCRHRSTCSPRRSGPFVDIAAAL